MLKRFAPLHVLMLILLIHGCARSPVTTSDEPTPVLAAPVATETALADLAAMRVDQANQTAVAWARDYLSSGRLDAARMMVEWVRPQQLSAPVLLDWTRTRGQLLLAEQKPDEALAVLDDERVRDALSQVSDEQAAQLSLLRADALTLKGEFLDSLMERASVDAALGSAQRDYNRQMIWTQLMLMPASDLDVARGQSTDDTLNGWLELASLYRDPLTDIDTQLQKFDAWQAQWPAHPAATNLPDMIQALKRAAKDRPDSVALLLPLNGPLADAAAAVRDGFITAYYSALAQGYPVPQVRFYDSGTDDVISLYNQALDAGTRLVIGPLDKQQVATLASVANLPVPTLSLNYVDNGTAKNLYQFGLAPEDEARQAAEQAITEGARLAAILYPEGEWGARVAEAFRQRFESLGGIVTTHNTYADNATAATRQLLDLGQSEARARQLNLLTSLRVEFEPRRRQDIDVIFLVAAAGQARQLKPALNFNYASDIPVFATSHVYAGTPAADIDSDLNGIRFVDIPWVLDHQSALHQDAERVWPSGHGRYERLFALGIDAYRLHTRLAMLQSLPESFLPGVTGQLSLDDQQRLVRELQWAWFSRGVPQRMPVVRRQNGAENVGTAVVTPATR